MFCGRHNLLALVLTAALGFLFVVPFAIGAAHTAREARDLIG